VGAGIAILDQRFTSNSSANLSNYQASTGAFGAQVGLGMWGALGKYFLLGADASYIFAGAGGVKTVVNGTTYVLGEQRHTADVAVAAGVHFAVLGGLSLRLRIGGQIIANLIAYDQHAPLPSDRILGLAVGIDLAAPALFRIKRWPFGAELYGGGLVPATRAQTAGLEDGKNSSTYGVYFGGSLIFQVMRPNLEHYQGTLAIVASYRYQFEATHYTGLANRINTVTIADRGSDQHLISAGLNFYY
jgi:hypothetical protein